MTTATSPTVTLTPNGETVQEIGALVYARTKSTPERRFPEALAALKAFGHDPAELERLLDAHDSLHLSTYEAIEYVRLAIVCASAILAEVKLPTPDYWFGMGGVAAAKKCGILPA